MSNDDFWKVNSYGYPNPFSSDKAGQAWETLLSFYRFSDYKELKDFWASPDAPRPLDHAAVESWKSTFEEFGLLYVLSRSGEITITPAGYQFLDAGECGQQEEFAWIGLNLLLRYPLRGVPRRSKGLRYDNSNILLYWFFYATLRDLDNQIYRPELDRVLCKVFHVSDSQEAIRSIQKLRQGNSNISQHPLPVLDRKGVFYNSMNQIIVHAGMNDFILSSDNNASPYGINEPNQRYWIRENWIPLLDQAMGSASSDEAGFVARMPKSPQIDDEIQYFEYLGASVPPFPIGVERISIQYTQLEGDTIAFLRHPIHYSVEEVTTGTRGLKVIGDIADLCRLALGQRIILSHDLDWTYTIGQKTRLTSTKVILSLRKSIPISDHTSLQNFLED